MRLDFFKRILSETDRKIISAYNDMSFPSAYYRMDDLNYIISSDSMLNGYCRRLLDNIPINDHIPCDEEEALIEKEFGDAIGRTEGEDRGEIIMHYHFYNLVRIIIKKYVHR